MRLLSTISSTGALDVLWDALLDSALILPILFLAHVCMALIDKYAGKKTRRGLKGPLSPLIGVAAGTLPQCGFSVAASRLYAQKYIPLGALVAVYIATSDEAVLILLSSADSVQKILPLLLIKIVFALVAGYTINLVAHLSQKNRRRIQKNGSLLITCKAADDIDLFCYDKKRHEIPPPPTAQELSFPSELIAAPCLNNSQKPSGGAEASLDFCQNKGQSPCECNNHAADCDCRNHNEDFDKGAQSYNCGCAAHAGKNAALHQFVLHPLVHTLKIFAYVLAVNLALGYIIFFVTPQRFEGFVSELSVWQPALAALLGLIPNCAAGVILAEMYANGLLTLGAAVAGLSAAAGLGYAVLIKEHKNKLIVLLIILGMFLSSTLVGMLVDLF